MKNSPADPANGPGPVASQILSRGGRTQQPAPEKSASRSTVPEDSRNPVEGQNGASRPESQEQRVGRAKREARKTSQKPDATANGVAVARIGQDVQPAQFLTILGDVQDMQAGVAKAQSTSSQVLSQLPGAASYTGPVTNNDGKTAAATGEANVADGGNQPGVSSTAQQTPARMMDALLEANQAVLSQGGNESKGSVTPPSDVAFAARISSKTEPRVMAPDEGQAAIAASRFEGMALRNQAASTPRTAQSAADSGVPGQPEEPLAVAASPFDAMASDSGSGKSQDQAEPDASAGSNSATVQPAGLNRSGQAAQTVASTPQPAAPSPADSAVNPASAAQPATSRAQGAQPNSGAMGTKTGAAGQIGSGAVAGPQNASASMVAAAPASVDAANARSSTNTKPAAQEHIAQDVEAQNEPVNRTGEAVRDISLNLSTKDQNVQVRLSERAGELHVTVRTPDAALTHGMREGLSDLVGRLEHGGYRAETWQPGGDSRDRGQESPSRRGFQQNAGGKGGGRQQNSQDPESESETPKWIGELESSFHKE